MHALRDRVSMVAQTKKKLRELCDRKVNLLVREFPRLARMSSVRFDCGQTDRIAH
jgi:hypothetical protein